MGNLRRGVIRYFLLSGLFGLVFGVRFTLDVWVLTQLGAELGEKIAVVGLTLVGMLIGEIFASTISDRITRRLPILASATCLAVWAILAAVAIEQHARPALVAGGFVFGVGFGLFHTSLDAWFAELMIALGDPKDLATRLTEGYLVYNLGYLLGSAISFPLILGLPAFISGPTLPQGHPLALWPYVVVVVASVALLFFAPPELVSREKMSMAFPFAFRFVRKDYADALKQGGPTLIHLLLVGGCVALTIQLVDHFAAVLLLDGASILENTVRISTFNLIVCLLLGFAVARRPASHGVARRNLQMSRALLISFLLFCACAILKYFSVPGMSLASVANIAAFGVAHAILLTLPPLIKASVLEESVNTFYGATASLLGLSKRLFGILTTIILNLTVVGVGGLAQENVAMYVLFAFLALFTYAMYRTGVRSTNLIG